jgi:signal peptidase I
MKASNTHIIPVDSRVVIFRVVRQMGIIVGAILIIKWLFIDTTIMLGNQMAPTLQKGDRVVFFRGIIMPPLGWISRPGLHMPVVVNEPFSRNKLTCLRIAAGPGDSALIANGTFVNMHHPKNSRASELPPESVLPPEYSPRDDMAPFRIPIPGETRVFDSLTQRDFFFVASMLAQEHPDIRYRVKPNLYIDDSLSSGYLIPDFSLYRGSLDSVPDSLMFNWFFWDRMREYLLNHFENRQVSIYFSLFDGDRQVFDYTVKTRFFFMLADNWSNGLDSRFYGPVAKSRIQGAVFGVLWSFGVDEKGRRAFRPARMGRIVF